MKPFDVRVMNEWGVWMTDTVTGGKRTAQERAKFLIPRVPAVQVQDRQGRRVDLEGA